MKTLSIIVPITGSPNKLWLRKLMEFMEPNSEKLEVILVGDVDEQQAKGLKYIKTKGNRSLARNLGIAASKGEYILFLDSDQYMPKSLLLELTKIMDQNFDAAVIPEKFIGLTIWGRASAIWKQAIQRIDQADSCLPRLYSRRALEKIGPFRSELTLLEDYELYLRAVKAGLKITLLKSPLIHLEPSHITDYLNKGYTYAGSLSRSIKALGIKNIMRKYSKAPLILIEALRSSRGIFLKLALLSLLFIKFIGLTSQILRRLSER
ncbi:MAG: hypothetical protein DRH17_13690 [Deltaproteobacteria bacterium]|nr:MAG: hypothetical protein DRH17_13690 [Deltaproteobacteria bacterium]